MASWSATAFFNSIKFYICQKEEKVTVKYFQEEKYSVELTVLLNTLAALIAATVSGAEQ